MKEKLEQSIQMQQKQLDGTVVELSVCIGVVQDNGINWLKLSCYFHLAWCHSILTFFMVLEYFVVVFHLLTSISMRFFAILADNIYPFSI